jgi:hypothetical protein
VRVVRASDLPVNTFPPFGATNTDAGSAQALLSAIERLPPLQTPVFCPADTGLSYRLTFLGRSGRRNR